MDQRPSTIARIAPVALVAVAIAALAFLGRAGEEAGTAPASPTGPANEFASGPVTIEGRVVDARTAAGVGRAVVIVLRPGVSTREWTEARGEAATEALMQAATVTAQDGTFTISELERGSSYTVMITAEGYEPAIFEQGLEILPTDPTFTRVKEVRLERA